jgi:hypothetical protein
MWCRAWWRKAARIHETLETARDVAKKLIEAQSGTSASPLPPAREVFDYPLIVAM